MRITLPNRYLQPVADLLAAMSLKPTPSRARSKLLALVREGLARFGEDEYALVTTYATPGADGKPVFDTDGTFQLANPDQAAEFVQAHNQLLDCLAEISGPTYHGHLNDIRDLLDAYEGELSGIAADAFDKLHDAITTAQTAEATEKP